MDSTPSAPQPMIFQPVATQPDYQEIQRRILKFWEEGRYFYRLMARNRGGPKFRFLDGPITANGPMGVHHAWGRTYKDVFQRYKAMIGFDQRFQNGFDCQGLWVEVEVEKELGFKSKRDIEKFGIDRFVEKCKERVLRFSRIQTQQSILIGQWMDWDNSYYTMSEENNYSIWYFLRECHRRGLIYEGTDVMPWCARCGTAISDMEIATEGYRQLTHPAVFVKFPVQGKEKESLLVWTTTPWTLSSNTGAAVHPELSYVRAKLGDEVFILAKERLGVLGPEAKVVEEFSGSELAGLRYRGPFDELPVQQGVEHRVVVWDEVSASEGTGIVHIAPGCGKEDFRLGKEQGLAVIAPLLEDGTFRDGFDWLSGRPAGEVAADIFTNLRAKGVLFRVEDYTHRYPVCWRCGEELVFRLVDEWFIRMDPLRAEIMDSARQVRWIPEFGLERELDWLRNMGDWCISKKRYWGLALPIFKCECGWFDVIGSREELRARAVAGWEKFEGHTPHRPWVDEVKIACAQCGQAVARIKDVGNPWLDAGIVPFSTTHYLTNRSYWQEWFPFDFITESFPGQFRNWFYAILAMSTVLERCAPFKTVLGYATMKAEDGREMHKSWGNAIEVEEAVEKMGADVMRWVFARHNPVQNLLFGFKAGQEVKRKLLTFWNVYGFFVTYANIDRINPAELSVKQEDLTLLDRWILSRLNSLVALARDRLDDYDCMSVALAVEEFIDDLSTWYVRRNRRRFWKSAEDKDKAAAYYTLYNCLVSLVKLLAPIMPFITEDIYQNLVRRCDPAAPESVHLCYYPEVAVEMIDQKLEKEMKAVRTLVSLGHAAREKAQVRVRQPLARMAVVIRNGQPAERFQPYLEIIKDELNIREVLFLKTGETMPAGLVIQTDDDYTVGIDTRLTPELEYEGVARELVRKIQSMRKNAGLQVVDRIVIGIQCPAKVIEAIQMFGDYIRQETLAQDLRFAPLAQCAARGDFDINGNPVRVEINKEGD
ncbi:MAG: isoleucine--tRNA ligase [candidate division WOR-3 bacterium]